MAQVRDPQVVIVPSDIWDIRVSVRRAADDYVKATRAASQPKGKAK